MRRTAEPERGGARAPVRSRPSERRRLLRFLAVGALNTALSFAVFQLGAALSHKPALALAASYLFGGVFAFLASSRLVFADHHAPPPLRFGAGVAALLILNLAGQRLLLAAGFAPRVSQIGLAPAMALVSYAMSRRLIFRRLRGV